MLQVGGSCRMVYGTFSFRGSSDDMAGDGAVDAAAGGRALAVLAEPKDWADVAAIQDRSLRVFSDAVRPALRGLPASKLSHSNLLLLTSLAAEPSVRLADLIRDGNMIASNAGYALKALREAGYVEVAMDPANRRTRIVTVTDEGRRVAGIIRERCRVLSPRAELSGFVTAAQRFEKGLAAAEASKVAPPSPRSARSAGAVRWSETVATSMQRGRARSAAGAVDAEPAKSVPTRSVPTRPARPAERRPPEPEAEFRLEPPPAQPGPGPKPAGPKPAGTKPMPEVADKAVAAAASPPATASAPAAPVKEAPAARPVPPRQASLFGLAHRLPRRGR